MSEIRLLAAPVILPSGVNNSASTSLVPASRLAIANRAIAPNDTAYPDDSFVWSVAAGDNGSFHFYAVPLKNFLNGGASSQQDGIPPAYIFAPNPNALNTSSAVAQYQLHASMLMPMPGRLLNVFA